MNKSMITGIVIGGAAATAVGGIAGYQMLDHKPAYADVIKAEPVYKTIKTPRQECKDVLVQHKAPVKDQNRIAGTAIGAVIGGLVGNQFGGGSGKTLTTVGGAVAGGYAGNQVQKNMQQNDAVTSTERRCQMVNEKTRQLSGYDVTYRYAGQTGTVRTSFKPGPTLPVKDGRVDTTPPQAEQS